MTPFHLDAVSVKSLTQEILEALCPIAERHGLVFNFQGGTLADPQTAVLKLQVYAPAEPGLSKIESDFKAKAARLGFAPSDLGREFTQGRSTLILAGYRDAARATNTIIVRDKATKKEYVMAPAEVKRALGLIAPSAAGGDEELRAEVLDIVEKLKASHAVSWSSTDVETALFQRLEAIDAKVGVGLRVGRIISYPAGDGYANYVVTDIGRKVKVAHIPFGDAWTSLVVRNGELRLGHAQDAIAKADAMRRGMASRS